MIDKFIRGYLECALQTEGDIKDKYTIEDISENSRYLMEQDCRDFCHQNPALLATVKLVGVSEEDKYKHLGSEFWLLRNGYTCQEEYEEEDMQDRMIRASECFPPRSLYVENGKVYLSGDYQEEENDN